MARIKLIIGDTDEAYTRSLADFLLAAYAQVFEAAIFTKPSLLKEHLLSREKPDILLLTPGFLEEIPAQADCLTVWLTSEPGLDLPDKKQLFKYQRGSRLVQELLRIYSSAENKPAALPSPGKKTKVIAVYSPAGGTGKTAIAVGCSFQSAWEGNRVFYLNLENMPSTKLFFTSEGGEGLSAVFYYLRQRKNILKIEALKQTDWQSGIHYFSPADSVMDLWEDLREDLPELIRVLRSSGHYDYLFLDLSSQINANNLAAMEASDAVFLVSTGDPVARLKEELLWSELQRWSARNSSNLPERIYPVWNLWEQAGEDAETCCWYNGRPRLKIPRVKNLCLLQGDRLSLDLNTPFGSALYRLRSSLGD